MILAALNLPNNGDLAPDEPYDAGDEPAPEPVRYLSSPGAVVYIYCNQARLKRPSALDDIVNGYQQRHPHTDFQPMAISLEDLKSRRYFAFPRTEQEFFQRGYAAELDARKGPVGRGTSTYLVVQKSVLHVQGQTMAHVVRARHKVPQRVPDGSSGDLQIVHRSSPSVWSLRRPG